MRLNSPKFITWLISLILGAVGLLSIFIVIPFVSAIAFWFVFAGLLLLLLANAIKGL